MFFLQRFKRRAVGKCFFSGVSNAELSANVFSPAFQTAEPEEKFCLQRFKRGFKSIFRGIFAPCAGLPAFVFPPPFQTPDYRQVSASLRSFQKIYMYMICVVRKGRSSSWRNSIFVK
jgi:hypothetical protein